MIRLDLLAFSTVTALFFAHSAGGQSQGEIMDMIQQMMRQNGGAVPGQPPIPPGRRDAGVAEVQSLLNAAGFNAGGVDGVAGPGTRAAIAQFQQSIGRAPTGILSEEELQALRAAAGKGQQPAAAQARGVDLAYLQAQLNGRGYDAGPVDGIWGQRSQSALMAFRQSQGVADAGPPGQADMALLRNRATPAAKPAAAPVTAGFGGLGLTTVGTGGQSLTALPAADRGASLSVAWEGPAGGHFWLAVLDAGTAPVPGIPAWPRGDSSPTEIQIPEAAGDYEIAIIDIRDGSVPVRRGLEVN